MLSGFILTYVYPSLQGAAAARRFLVARFARLWPAHIATLLIALVMFLPMYQAKPGGFPFAVLAANALMVHGWIPAGEYYFSFNSPSWSISTEFLFYFCFIFLIGNWRRTWWWKAALALAMAFMFTTLTVAMRVPDGLQQVGVIDAPGLTYINPLARLFEFTLGMMTVLAWRYAHSRLRVGVRAGTVIEALAIVVAAVWVAENSIWFASIGTATALVPYLGWLLSLGAGPRLAFALVIGVLALERGAISRTVLAWRPLVVLGEISFSVYLLHNLVLFHYGSHRPSFDAVPGWLGYLVYWALLLCASFLMWRLMEIPCRRWIVGWTRPGARLLPQVSPRALLRGIVPRRDVAFAAVAFVTLLLPVGYVRETFPLPHYLPAAEGAAATLRGVPEVRAVRFGPSATASDAAIELVGGGGTPHGDERGRPVHLARPHGAPTGADGLRASAGWGQHLSDERGLRAIAAQA